MSGRKDEAVEKLATFLEFAPDDSAVAQILGDIMYEKGDLARAVKMYELCVSLEPGAYAVITKLADTYHRQGHLESARLGYMQALKIKSDYEPALTKLDKIESSTPNRA
jgi:Flp pilus assembly protein TadD